MVASGTSRPPCGEREPMKVQKSQIFADISGKQAIIHFLATHVQEQGIAQKIAAEIQEVADTYDVDLVVINFSRVQHMTSAFIGRLIALNKSLKAAGIKLRLCCMATTVAEAYRLPRKPPGILIATYQGRRGHPAIFSVDLLGEIEDWADDRGLNELAQCHSEAVRQWEITTGPMPIDVNTPEDYRRLCEEG